VTYLVLEYQLCDDYLQRRATLRQEHLELANKAYEDGLLRLAGALADPADRALLVWSTDDRAVVERFVAADPYVRAGLVLSWTVRDWTVAVGAG
jgi:uncharacterized protein YciI